MAASEHPWRDYTLNLAYRALLAGALALPYRWRVPLMGWVMRALVAPLAGWRKRVRENLALVRPDLPKGEVRRLERAVPDNFGRSLIEIYSGAEFIERVKGIVPEGPGVAAIEQARAEGRPMLLVTGHFGNYDAPRSWLSHHGYDIGGLYSPMSNVYFNAHYVAALRRLGEPLFARDRTGIMAMVRHLKAGGVLGMVVDQHVPRGAVLQFFGKPAKTTLSPADLALRFNALLVPTYGIRQPDGLSFAIRVEEPIPHGEPAEMAQALNDSIEAMARDYPAQWMWIHRRWKLAAKRGDVG